jgi:hypothetical protein
LKVKSSLKDAEAVEDYDRCLQLQKRLTDMPSTVDEAEAQEMKRQKEAVQLTKNLATSDRDQASDASPFDGYRRDAKKHTSIRKPGTSTPLALTNRRDGIETRALSGMMTSQSKVITPTAVGKEQSLLKTSPYAALLSSDGSNIDPAFAVTSKVERLCRFPTPSY